MFSQYPISSSQPEDIAVALQLQQESLDAHRQAEERRPLLERIFGSEEQSPLDESTEGSSTITLIYNLKDGRQINRLYYVSRSFSSIQTLKTIWSSPDYLFDVELLDENHQFDRALLKKKLEAAVARCDCNAGELYYNRTTHQLGEQEIDSCWMPSCRTARREPWRKVCCSTRTMAMTQSASTSPPTTVTGKDTHLPILLLYTPTASTPCSS